MNRSEYIANISLAKHAPSPVSDDMRDRNLSALWAARHARDARRERIARALYWLLAASLAPFVFIAATGGI